MGLSGWSGNIIPGFFTPCGRDVVLLVVSTPISLLATFSLWIITVYNKDQGFKTNCRQLTSVIIRSVITSVKCLKMNHRNNSNYTVIKFLPSATKLRRLCFYRRLSVHRGRVGVSASVHAGIPPPSRSRHPPTPPGEDTPQEQTLPGADTPPSRHPPRADTPWEQTPTRADTPPEQTPPRADTPPEQTHTSQEQTPPPPRYGHCCGRFASYWNAFLYSKNILSIVTILPTVTPRGDNLPFTVKNLTTVTIYNHPTFGRLSPPLLTVQIFENRWSCKMSFTSMK